MSLQNRRGMQNRNTGQNNMNSNKGQGSTGRIRLRRNVNKQHVIEQNLSHMQQQAHKKRLAQELYYNNQGNNRSPLLRLNTHQNQKTSVHNRLGATMMPSKQNIITRKPMPAKNQGGNRIRLRRQVLQPELIIKNNIIRKKNERMKRLQNPAQTRILRIRQNNVNQNRQLNQNIAGQQKIRLRRNRNAPGPVNYTVQVVNNGGRKQSFGKHNATTALNPKLQQEIRLIQNKNVNHDEIEPVPIHPTGTGFTGTSLHERFSHL